MAKLLIINCEDCGWPRITARKNTKYCYVCRLARNLAFIKDRKFKCVDCGNTLMQVTRNEDLCKECDEYSTPESVTGHCAFCDQEERRLISDDIRVCVHCIHDPSKRSIIRTALKHKINARKSGEVEPPVLELPTPNRTQGEERVAFDEGLAYMEQEIEAQAAAGTLGPVRI